jgi:hypothetical protein
MESNQEWMGWISLKMEEELGAAVGVLAEAA